MFFWRRATLIFLFYFCTLPAQDYLWPTDASKNVTSSFGEFRPRHFHAAMDIKTWGQTGYKIFAVEDGYIYRIRVSSQGYGKVIYLKLKDGYFAIYAHLNGFIPKLEDYTDSLRLAARNNTLDTFPRRSKFPVKKGDLLGYTGDTGIGVPHLHFEMRDPKNFPINPWQFYKNEIADGLAPFCNSLAVIPMSVSTLINFKPDTLILNLQPRQKITISEPIFLTGKAYIAIKSFDQANGADNLFSFYEAKLFINNSLQYQVKYDRFSYAETRLIELDKNFSLWRRGLGVFHNLFRHPFNSLSFYENSPKGSGVLSKNSLNEGLNNIRIELYDFDGNHSGIELQVVYHKHDQLKVFDLSTVSKVALIGLKATASVESVEVKYWNSDLTKSIATNDYQLKLLNNFMSNYFYSLSLPIHPRYEYNVVQINSFDRNNLPLIPLYINLNESNSDTTSENLEVKKMRFSGNQFAVQTKGPIQIPNQYNISPAIELQPDPHMTYAVFNLSAFTDYSEPPLSDVHNWVQIIPGRKTTAFSPDNNVRVDFFEDAAYDTFFCKIAIEESPHNFATDYPILTQTYKVNPFDQALNRGAVLSFTIPDSIRSKKGLGVYYWDAKKGWLFLPTDSFRENGTLQSRITSLEKFAIIKDAIPPEIIPYNQVQFGALYINKNPLKIGVRDKMSGIYDQDQIEVLVDNNWTLFRYDPEEDQIIIAPRHIPAGQHRLKITATDNVGNQSVKEFGIIK
jgi:murein DD-endopeptidase MepM/ murein hydrolase activator NlpD